MTDRRKKQVGYFVIPIVIAAVMFNVVDSRLGAVEASRVPLWLVAPFVLLLLAIAFAPFVDKSGWERNALTVVAALSAFVATYYVYPLSNFMRVILSLRDYAGFLSLIGSLYVVAGGIHISLRGKSAPYENVILLGAGALLSNVLGTTGASMLLIRPFLRNNRYRISGYHIVFFIFIVSNIGGALTPIGDPPLFLGYLKGVPFFWIFSKAWVAWASVVAMLLAVFAVIDWLHFRRIPRSVQREAMRPDEARFSGTHNFWFLALIIAAVFIEHPSMLREVIMWSAALGSFLTTSREVHRKNEFSFAPLKEVAVLFAGIFVTMIPALDWLELNALSLGIHTPGQFFFWSGALSSVLDNAPTYLSFLSAAFGLHGASVDHVIHMNAMLGAVDPVAVGLVNPIVPGAFAITADSWKYVQAISIGSVFFGAMTYIGNGPNFMVKSIADQAGIKTPSFVEYIWKYSIPLLLPLFVLVWLFMFRG
ncbi:MAG TPA: sodium:proton antiporter [Bacteroidota bacterium]|nr:sodium:proton antiporter [Bacteroidota bacterium]